jgi:anaerobic magnesium-protoporphyrin IX monomethyl ester cyclase
MGIENGYSDIVFVFPPAHGNVGAFRNHLGAAYLRAALARDGFTTKQYLNPAPGTVRQVADELLESRPLVIGFTVYDANLMLSLALARAIKAKRAETRVVFGGPAASFCAEQLMTRHPSIDLCVLGEAEETGSRIFRALLDGGDFPEGEPGIAVRRDGRIALSEAAPLVGIGDEALPLRCALDATPSPYLSNVLQDGRIGILTGRGCTHHCQYCCFAALGRKRLRLHSTERVLAELEFIAEQQKRTGERFLVPIHDDAFTLAAARAKTLCQAIIDRGLDLMLSCITRADALDEELIQLMRKAGFISLAFGLESAVPHVLRSTGKVRPPDWPNPDLTPESEFVEKVRTSVIAAKKHGFNVGVSIILGLPGETAEDGAETMRFVKALPIDYYMHNFLWVFPGTPLWQTHDRYKIGCEIGPMGTGTTTEYAYDLNRIRPRPKCSLEQDAKIARLLAADALASCGAPSAPGTGISFAVIDAPHLSAETAAWLAEVLNVGGTVLHLYPKMTRSNEYRQLYCDREMLGNAAVPARHYIHQLPRGAEAGAKRWLTACSGTDLYETHKPELLTIHTSDTAAPLLRWLSGEPAGCTMCEGSDCIRDVRALLQFADVAGDAPGARMRRMPPPPDLEYAGRWVRGRAPCLSMARVEITADGAVRVCRHGLPIGKVGDSVEALSNRLSELARQAEARRGCDNCMSELCPRCPFPGMSDRTYCGLMKKQERALGVLNWIHSYARIPSLVATQRDRFGGD